MTVPTIVVCFAKIPEPLNVNLTATLTFSFIRVSNLHGKKAFAVFSRPHTNGVSNVGQVRYSTVAELTA